MNIKKIRPILALASFSLAASFSANIAFAGPEASIDDLSWMTGTWTVDFGPNTLEENWITPDGGSIAAMVRMSGNGTTSMFEVITIEEKEGSLMMSVQQWDTGFVPRSEKAQILELEEISENHVKFIAVTEGSMTSLAYSRPTPTTFTIDMGTPNGGNAELTLEAKK